MGHRHLFGASQMFGSDQDQNWNCVHSDQPCVNMAGSIGSDNGPPFCLVDNITLNGVHFSPHWNAAARSTCYYSSSGRSIEAQRQPDGSASSHDLFLHPSAPGMLPMAPEIYAHHASSSNYERHSYYGVEGGVVDLTVGNGRGPHKRKTTGFSSVGERGNASRYFSPGSSSRVPPSSDLCQEKFSLGSQLMPWDHPTLTPSCRGNGLSIRGEECMRNVRSRSSLDLGSNLPRNHLSSNPSYCSYSSSCAIDHSNMLNLPGQSSNASTREWNLVNMSPAHGKFLASDASGFIHETNKFPTGGGASSVPLDLAGPRQDFAPSNGPIVPQGLHGGANQYVRGAPSSYSQRTNPIPGTSSSSLHMGRLVPSNDESPLVNGSYCTRYPPSFSTAELHGSEQNRRSRLVTGRYRSISDYGALHDPFSSEGFMIVDHSPYYGSRNMIDQHREMRLDVDNMSYEELLALGERIGHVSTGLSEDLISKCLMELIYCSDQTHEEGTCVICLVRHYHDSVESNSIRLSITVVLNLPEAQEGYKDMDGVGSLRACGHDYHVQCIKIWLSMKNLCPICKAAALTDKMMGK